MNQIKYIASVMLLSAVTVVNAQSISPKLDEAGFYAGFDLGAVNYNSRFTGDENATKGGVGLKLGYDFNRNVAVEVAHETLGQFDEKDSTSNKLNQFRLQATSISGIGRYPINDAFDVYGKLGYARLSVTEKINFQSGGYKLENNTIFAVGARYAITPEIGFYSELGRMASGMSKFKVGVAYKF